MAEYYKIDPYRKFFEIDPCFCVSGYTYPLAMMGTALDRCLPVRYSMLANEAMYYFCNNLKKL